MPGNTSTVFNNTVHYYCSVSYAEISQGSVLMTGAVCQSFNIGNWNVALYGPVTTWWVLFRSFTWYVCLIDCKIDSCLHRVLESTKLYVCVWYIISPEWCSSEVSGVIFVCYSSPFGIPMGYGVESWGVNAGRGEIFLLLHSAQTNSGVHVSTRGKATGARSWPLTSA